MAEGLTVNILTKGEVKVIQCRGYIDTATSSMLEKTLEDIIKSNGFKIVIDLGEVDYISSAGWGIFISEIRNIRKHKGDLKLVNMKPEVMEIFELLDFTNIIEYYKSVDDAVRNFK